MDGDGNKLRDRDLASDVGSQALRLRREHQDAEIVTEHVQIDDRIAVFKAMVAIPGGGKATGHGSVVAAKHPNYIEDAEMKALSRALSLLGYGVVVADEPRVVEEPAPPPVAPASQPPEEIAGEEEIRPTPLPSRNAAPRTSKPAAPAPVEMPTTRERAAPPAPTPFPSAAAPRAVTPAAPAPPDGDEPPLEDYSWTAFWRWAREQGYDSKGGIEAFIGRPMNNLNPADVRQLIIAKRETT